MITFVVVLFVSLAFFFLKKTDKKRNGGFYFLTLIKILSFSLIIFWPLFFWFFYYKYVGYVPLMGNDDLSSLFGFDLEGYGISRWWDQVVWLLMILFLILVVEISSAYKIFKEVNFLLLGVIFFLFSLAFLSGPLYILTLFVFVLLIYLAFSCLINLCSNKHPVSHPVQEI
jgi:hypothetical protein